MSSGAACRYTAFCRAMLLSPCGRPKIIMTTTSIHTGLCGSSLSSNTHARSCANAATMSLPRIRSRRPVMAETTRPVAKIGSVTMPAWMAVSPRPACSHCVTP